VLVWLGCSEHVLPCITRPGGVDRFAFTAKVAGKVASQVAFQGSGAVNLHMDMAIC
jgi:hypothetical protein